MNKIILVFLSTSILFFGIFVGIILENIRQSEQKKYNFSPVEISEKTIPVVTLYQIENGELSGELQEFSEQNTKQNQIRIIIENKKQKKSQTHIIKSGNFSINITEILPMLKSIPHPENMKFVASKRGKKYYPIDSPRAFLITPKNRIFFVDTEDAEKKGFKKY